MRAVKVRPKSTSIYVVAVDEVSLSELGPFVRRPSDRTEAVYIP